MTNRSLTMPLVESPTCRSCGLVILWTQTVAGGPLPLDPIPSVAGDYVIETANPDGTGARRSVYARGTRLDEPHYTFHGATCRDGASWRASSRAERGAS